MTPDHERLSTSDGAYVLGALNAPDRAEFEAHLAVCAECRASVAELAPTAGLLSRLSVERARAVGESTGPVPIAAPDSSPNRVRARRPSRGGNGGVARRCGGKACAVREGRWPECSRAA